MQPRQTSPSTTARPVSRAAQEPERRDEKQIEFILKLPSAKSVAVAGSFNSWDVKKAPLRKDSNGGWKGAVSLPPGRYEYRFVVNGTEWLTDPSAKESVDNGMGGSNSVLVV